MTKTRECLYHVPSRLEDDVEAIHSSLRDVDVFVIVIDDLEAISHPNDHGTYQASVPTSMEIQLCSQN